MIKRDQSEIKENILVSVIMPTYNRAHLIQRAIKSVILQTYHNFELIIVDDASTDSTKETVLSFKDERIIYLRHPINKGGSGARNTGIKMAQGEYITFLDSDDELFPEKLEKQIQAFLKSDKNLGLVGCDVILIDNESNDIIKKMRNPIYFMIKKECFSKVGFFDETLDIFQDLDLDIRMQRSCKCLYIPEVLVKYYLHNQQIQSANLKGGGNAKKSELKRVTKGYEILLNKHNDILSNNDKKKFHFMVGHFYCFMDESYQARSYFIKAIKLSPFQIKPILGFILSFLPKGYYKAIFKLKHKFRVIF